MRSVLKKMMTVPQKLNVGIKTHNALLKDIKKLKVAAEKCH